MSRSFLEDEIITPGNLDIDSDTISQMLDSFASWYGHAGRDVFQGGRELSPDAGLPHTTFHLGWALVLVLWLLFAGLFGECDRGQLCPVVRVLENATDNWTSNCHQPMNEQAFLASLRQSMLESERHQLALGRTSQCSTLEQALGQAKMLREAQQDWLYSLPICLWKPLGG